MSDVQSGLVQVSECQFYLYTPTLIDSRCAHPEAVQVFHGELVEDGPGVVVQEDEDVIDGGRLQAKTVRIGKYTYISLFANHFYKDCTLGLSTKYTRLI